MGQLQRGRPTEFELVGPARMRGDGRGAAASLLCPPATAPLPEALESKLPGSELWLKEVWSSLPNYASTREGPGRGGARPEMRSHVLDPWVPPAASVGAEAHVSTRYMHRPKSRPMHTTMMTSTSFWGLQNLTGRCDLSAEPGPR